MAQGLILYNGALLLVNGGLTVDPNCCCDPPPPCPPCCVRIDFGTFDSDGNLFGEFAEAGHTIEVLITMPTKFSRIICDEQQIAVRWSYFDGEGNPADADGGFVRFGNGWIGGAGSPAIAGDGIFLVRGLIDWGVSASATFYEAGFTFRECFMDSSFFLYYLDIGLTSPAWSETIEISRCPSPELCCPESVECADCCALLVQNDAVRFEGAYYFYDESFDAGGGRYTLIVQVRVEDGGKVCIGESLDIEFYLVPARANSIPGGVLVTANHPTWIRTGFTPPINAGGAVADNSVQWGLSEDLEYLLGLEALDCDDECTLPENIFGDIEIIADLFGNVSLSFFKCDLEDCCPPPCSYVSGIFNTGQVSTESREDDEAETCTVDDHWQVNGGKAFIHPRFGGDMNYGCESANWVVVRCSTIAEPGGADGYEATFSTTFEIAEGTCLSRVKLVGEYSADNYVVAGEWKVNGIDQAHIPHGSFNETTTIGCVEFEITNVQGGFQVGTNTIAIKVKNGFVGSGTFGGPFGLLLSYACVEAELVP